MASQTSNSARVFSMPSLKSRSINASGHAAALLPALPVRAQRIELERRDRFGRFGGR